MKAAFALIVIYVGMFFVAIQGGPPSSVQAAAQSAGEKQNGTKSAAAIDPMKDSDIRALLELVGARDQVQDSVRQTAEQYREKLLATVPNNEKGQAFVNTTINEYEKRYDVDRVTEQLVALYDKHYSDEEIKSLLQFYGSPLGQKVAAESPKIFREIQETTRSEAAKAVRDALQQAKQENPGVGQNARLSNGNQRRPLAQRTVQPQDAGQQTAQQQDQP
ncbi:MAG TPA: DUF2059 domain-containing protein [Candidatus Acidoferrales bacterium]|jgi:hypothetical protein|nr:DUF2059 domain-containing protein [Candidatus Acidoferrales bacterium]